MTGEPSPGPVGGAFFLEEVSVRDEGGVQQMPVIALLMIAVSPCPDLV